MAILFWISISVMTASVIVYCLARLVFGKKYGSPLLLVASASGVAGSLCMMIALYLRAGISGILVGTIFMMLCTVLVGLNVGQNSTRKRSSS